MNACDHGHETHQEVRVLPLGNEEGCGNIILCQFHYHVELKWRLEVGWTNTGWEFPAWELLTIYTGE